MTKMIDTEGDALPNNGPDDKYDNCWDINLWGDGELSLSQSRCSLMLEMVAITTGLEL